MPKAMKQRIYSKHAEKALYALSYGKCNICKTDLIIEEKSTGKKKNIGKIAHIYDFSPNGPGRASDILTPQELNNYKNLVLLCGRCHDICDTCPQDYPPNKMLEIKNDHTAALEEIFTDNMSKITFAELDVVAKAIAFPKTLSFNTSTDKFLLPPSEKINKNKLSHGVSNLIAAGLTQAKLVDDCLNSFNNVSPDFSENLKEGFQRRYAELKQDGAEGDTLFSELINCWNISSNSPMAGNLIPSAVIAVVSYLFERCDLFER